MLTWVKETKRKALQLFGKDPCFVNVSYLFPKGIRALAHVQVMNPLVIGPPPSQDEHNIGYYRYEYVFKMARLIDELPKNTKTFLEKNPLEIWFHTCFPSVEESYALHENLGWLGLYFFPRKIMNNRIIRKNVIAIRSNSNYDLLDIDQFYVLLHELAHYIDYNSNLKYMFLDVPISSMVKINNNMVDNERINNKELFRREFVADHITKRLFENLRFSTLDFNSVGIEHFMVNEETANQIDRAIEEEGIL